MHSSLVADRYRLLHPLGEGGMGRVWRARDEVLHRDVAIKELVPPPGLTDDERRELRARSMREARAVARLNHPNIVRIFDVFESAGGDPWIVMEYLPGRSLDEAMHGTAGGTLPVRQVAHIGLQILQALQAAHELGVVHRDVKRSTPDHRSTPDQQTQSNQPAQSDQPAQTTPLTAGPAPTPSAQGFQLPAGWQMRDDGTGFKVPVPDGWQFGRDGDGRAMWQDPATKRLLLIDQSRSPKPDPVQDWRNNETARRDGYRDYQRIRLDTVSYWDRAADWEFTYTLGGTPVHVLNRGFITAPDQAYSIYWRTPTATWDDNRDDLQVVLDGFVPARS